MPALPAFLDELDAWLLLALLGIPFMATLLFIPWAVVHIPADYFKAQRRHAMPWRTLHPVLRLVLLALKNLLGLALLAMGVAMLVLPGQGLLTILIGLLLLDFPGKFRLERALVERKPILNSINWLRKRQGQPPLEV